MNDLRSRSISRIAQAVRDNRRFLVATHVRPDGDAAGSLLGMTYMLRALGKIADPFTQDPIPPDYFFLTGAESVRHEIPDPSLYDAAILVDCGDFERVGPALQEAISRVPLLINIDHHISDAPFGHLFWVDTSASSACQMLYELCLEIPVALDENISSQLYTGILTDTGSFRFSNTNQQVLQIAADLVKAGAKPDVIAQQVFDSAVPQRLRLLARVLSTVSFHADDRLATAELTRAMFQETDSSPLDSDGFINQLRSVKTVQIAIMFREGDDDSLIYVSMRSKGKVDVASLARKHGGGGHRNAAACRAPGSIEDVRAQFTREAMGYLI